MTISDLDLQIGQLALARGIIDLSTLLECVTIATSRSALFEEIVVETGHIDRATLVDLKQSLREMTPDQIADAVDEGETIAMQTLVERSQRESHPLVDELLEPIEQATTLDSPPLNPPLTESNRTEADAESESENAPFAEARYEFLEELGRGGMGQILRAEDQLLEREIALKTILPDTTVDQPHQRLLAEARLTGQLEHPSIVPVYELGRLSNGEPYYTMRVITERSLETILEELRHDSPDAPSLLHMAQIIRQICLAIQYAHERGIIHRDLKPENILIGEYGEVFVIDWGIAKILTHLSDAPSPTTDAENKIGALVGTPQYMAPEQAHGENDAVDERTDVYALGALLYEIMTLTPVFSSPTVLGLLMAIVQEQPEPPSQRAPDRDIPRPLEEICLRALSKDPDDRFPSAVALADELDLFIEGVKDQERKKSDALELIEQARKARQNYDRARRELTNAIERRDELRASIPAWADESERVVVWESEDRVEDLEVAVERHFGKTVRLLSQSLGHMSLPEAHDALASMYWERFVKAENRDDLAVATYFENLVRQHDTGAFTDRLRGLGHLNIRVQPAETELALYRVTENHRRLVAHETVTRETHCLNLNRLPHGRYRLAATAPGFAPIQMPLFLQRQGHQNWELSLWPRQLVPDDFVVIPGGPFQTGSPDEGGHSQRTIDLSSYAIQRTPVTCAEYVEFLNALARTDLAMARRHAPRIAEDAPSYFPIVDGRFTVPKEDSDGDAWHPNWPICMVNYDDATAYIRWRSRRDGLSYRLPTSMEWEKAARGVDGRLYPWGNHFDPSFCNMKYSTRGKPVPVPVGSFEVDRSPYGVVDMAGNIADWTSTEHGETPGTYTLRGGFLSATSLLCRLDWYMDSPATHRHPQYGFRLLLELSDPPET